jgi:hypothetical protein
MFRRPSNAAALFFAFFALGSVVSCGDESDPAAGGAGDATGDMFPMSSVVFGPDTNTTYVNLLRNLDRQDIAYDEAREFAGWADLWVHEGKIFVADGEAPVVARHEVRDDGTLREDGRVSFASYGEDTAAFWRNVFVAPRKAYYFAIEAREVVVWDPERLEITGTFSLPALEDRGAQQPYVTTDRAAIVRGDRLYLPVGWGDWDTYSLSEDSAILVIDTASDEVVDSLPAACPDLNVSALDERGDIYFSNWVYGVAGPLFEGSAHTCAVRIKAGAEVIDEDWSLTFADVTGGREAAALRLLGPGKALISVFHHEEAGITPEADRFAVIDSASWKFWTLDLDTLQAEPLTALDWHSGGYSSTRIDGRNLLFVPSGDYASTQALELTEDGGAEPRWETLGWATRLFKLR